MNIRAFLAALLLAPSFLAMAEGASRTDALRLLRQASFGPTESEVAHVMAIGVEAWVDEQLALPATAYPAYPYVAANRPQTCVDNRAAPLTAASFCARDNYTLFLLQRQFFQDAIGGRDQLR